ncbi:MAG: hypothetical protein JXA45_05565, partial [Methanomassiliicoccales archaeon]|nr:hypothetical protein [Methanomassiliicoccales archaeon]
MDWAGLLERDPTRRLLSSQDAVVKAFVQRHLLDRKLDLREAALNCADVRRILAAQKEDGSWHAPVSKDPADHATLVTTFKQFRRLVHRYEIDNSNEAVGRAAEHLLSYQTTEGDIRGMIGGQYATYYTGEMIALFLRAGLEDDRRIEKGMSWLLSMRQDDGGWTIPLLTHHLPW